MRALLAGQRHATIGVVLGLVGVLCLSIVSVGQTLYVDHKLQAFQRAAYRRCMDRIEYDRQSNALRDVEAQQWHRLAALDEHDTATPDDNAARADAYRQLTAAADRAVAAQVRSDCSAYRP